MPCSARRRFEQAIDQRVVERTIRVLPDRALRGEQAQQQWREFFGHGRPGASGSAKMPCRHRSLSPPGQEVPADDA
jgi:hypothetical protein